ncbi:MAG: catechol 2,3-dioxygenase [Tissierellia bacterium]|jgi:catechol 2,3-dioxygenase|nr:catechol 2,3-dioxygenase [Tissierellia bacterium]HZK01093.1 catechol 2,3-dioxygenase [Tissierellaceae bacterium]
MALTGILRAGLFQIRVLDLEESVEFYHDRLGLNNMGKIGDDRVMMKGYDEFDHHSFVLREADSPGIDFMCFKADNEETVADVVKKNDELFGYERFEVNDQPGFGTIHMFKLPNGHTIGVYSEVELAEQHPMILNPKIWDEEPRGMAATLFDHALLAGPNQGDCVNWFVDVLGMSITEVLYTEDKEAYICTWLSGNTRGHDVALLNFPEPGKLHHASFKLESWNDIGRAADIMARYDIKIDAGPMRHGITRGQTIYFFDPSGNRLETYAGGYEYFPDVPLREWTADKAGEGIFYYTKELNERFLNVLT